MKARGASALFSNPGALSQHSSQLFRKGMKGDWRNMLTQEMSDYVDDMVKQRCPEGLHFDEWKYVIYLQQTTSLYHIAIWNGCFKSSVE